MKKTVISILIISLSAVLIGQSAVPSYIIPSWSRNSFKSNKTDSVLAGSSYIPASQVKADSSKNADSLNHKFPDIDVDKIGDSLAIKAPLASPIFTGRDSGVIAIRDTVRVKALKSSSGALQFIKQNSTGGDTAFIYRDNSGTPLLWIDTTGRLRTVADIYTSGYFVYSYLGVSDAVILSHDAEASINTDSYTKMKSILLGQYLVGSKTLRINFDIKSDDGGLVYGKIYKNGVAAGTEQSTASLTYVTKSEDIAGWVAGDTMQIYVKSLSGDSYTYIRNFRVCGTMATIVNEITGTNTTP